MEFYELNIWKKGYELVLEVYRVTSQYPKEERFGLVAQTREAAISVIAQIAEAHGRYSFSDRVRVLYQARGEAAEVRSHLRVAFGLKYLSTKDFQYLDTEYNGLGVGINSYIASLSRYKKS